MLKGYVSASLRTLVATFGFFLLARCAEDVQSQQFNAKDVPTQRFNNARTGVYVQPGLNPSSFAPANQWGKLGELAVDAAVYAQPLYVSGLMMPDRRFHDVVYVATARNTIYAFDAVTLGQQPLWTHHFAPPDTSDTEQVVDCNKEKTNISTAPIDLDGGPHPGKAIHFGAGVLSTPVIDRAAQRLYVSYRTLSKRGPQQHIAALSLSGKVLLDHLIEPSEFSGSVTGLWQRASLLLSNGLLYVGFAAHSENPCLYPSLLYRGQLLVFDASNLSWLAKWVPVTGGPNRSRWGGGIWQGSTGIAADDQGDVYFAVGNSMSFPWNDNDFKPDSTSLSNAVVRLHADRTVRAGISMNVVDWFMPYRAYWQNRFDFDLAGSGPILVPNTHSLLVGGKEGIIYVLDRNNLGRLDTAKAWHSGNLELLHDPALPQDPEGTPRDQIQYCPPFLNAAANYKYSPDDPAADHPNDPTRANFQKITVGRNLSIADPRLDCWLTWPHIHGAPVYADFSEHGAFFYIWPEKDHLKAYRQQSGTPNLKFMTNPAVADGVAPVPFGMPGGMLAVARDPDSTGVLFGSAPMEIENENVPDGILRAFDPIPGADGKLHELWNNLSDSYKFAKFVPPTIAGGRVFLATFSNQILVYGPGWKKVTTGNVIPSSHIGAALQDPSQEQITAMLVDATGSLRVFWEENDAPWKNQAVISAPGLAPPGAPVTLAFEPDGRQLDAFVVGLDGAVYILSDTVPAPWTAPERITPPSFAPIGAKIATLVQGSNTFDAFVVGTDGAIHVLWNVAHQGWSNASISHPGRFAAGSRNSAGHQDCTVRPGCTSIATGDYHPGELDLVAINLDGAFCIFNITLLNPQSNVWSAWIGPSVYGPAQNDAWYKFPPNADIVAAKQFAKQLDAFVVGNDGILNVMWIKQGANWRRNAISARSFAPPGASLGVGTHGSDRLDTFVVGNDGALSVFSSLNGSVWSFTRTPSFGVAAPGAPIGISVQRSKVGFEVLDALIAGRTGVSVSFAVNPVPVICHQDGSCPYPPHCWENPLTCWSRPNIILR